MLEVAVTGSDVGALLGLAVGTIISLPEEKALLGLAVRDSLFLVVGALLGLVV